MAEKIDYDSEKVNQLQHQSVIFKKEFEDIHNDYQERFEDMRRQTINLQNVQQLLL